MKKLCRYIRLYRIFAVQYLKTMMQSKVDFLIGLGGFLVSQAAGIAFLYLVFEQIPSMKNWSLEQMLFIYGFAQIPRGLDHLFTDNIWMVAWQMVIKGTFDKYLLRPMNLFFQIICEKIQPDALGELLIGFVLVARAVRNRTVEVTPLKVVFFLISVLAGTVIYTAVKLFFASTAFWFKDSSSFLTTAYEMADFAKYPIEIYSKPIQVVLTTVLPFAFVAYIPSTFFLVNANVVKTIGVECIIAVLFWLIAYGLFQKGLTRYESAGN
ncbi:MAG: ABC-2 family transporter protein [Lachnospiraceae bacterium]|nr:ABC-2 family transporter protein [Lachnospiraceae bacterium]